MIRHSLKMSSRPFRTKTSVSRNLATIKGSGCSTGDRNPGGGIPAVKLDGVKHTNFTS